MRRDGRGAGAERDVRDTPDRKRRQAPRGVGERDYSEEADFSKRRPQNYSAPPRDRDNRESYRESYSNSNSHFSSSSANVSASASGGGGGDGDDSDLQLFVGNIVAPHVTGEDLTVFLNQAMRDSGMVGRDQADPILNCRLTGKYGFIDFRNPHDCTMGLNLNGIPFKGANVKIGRPVRYAGPITVGRTWQEFTSSSYDEPSGSSNSAPVQKWQHPTGELATKPFREIFIGFTSPDMTETILMDYLGNAMLKMGMSNSGLDNPFLVIKTSGKFAFAVTRTVEDAANILNFNGIPLMGCNLKVERPARFDGQLSGISHYNWDELYRIWSYGDLKLKTAGSPTRIIRISNMATPDELTDPTFYLDLMEDTRAEFSQFGSVKSIVVPRPIGAGNGAMYAEKDIGKVFIEMGSIEEAKNALLNLKGHTFGGRTVDMKFYPDDKFRAQNYSHELQGIIITSSFGPVFKEQVYTTAALSKIWSVESSSQNN